MRSSSGLNSEYLLNAARDGGVECRGRLLQLYASYLELMAVTQLDDRLRVRVSPSDIVQDTMLEAHRDFGQFRGTSPAEFFGWLRKILANNLARAVERHVTTEKRNVRREVALEEFGAAFDRSTARLEAVMADRNNVAPSDAVQRSEQLLLLADQLALLPDDHRQVLVLRHLKDMSFKEIAKRMDRSPGALRMLWMRAIDGLRQRLQELDIV